MKKILVAGGAGFIGSHTIVELHNSGFEPIILDNFCNSEESVITGIEEICGRKFTLYNEDCNDKTAMENIFQREGEIFGAIHFAAYKAVGESVSEPLKYYENNIGSLMTLVGAMKKHGSDNIVFSSSCTVYGEPEKLPVTESTPWQKASSPYGYTKQVCESLLYDEALSSESKISSVLLRYFNPIGAHPSGLIGELPIGTPKNLIPFITQTAAGIRESLTIFGNDYNTVDGTCVRDYIHVVDLAKAHVSALKWMELNPGKTDVFNVGTGNGNSVLEVVKAFEKVSGAKLNYNFGPRRAGDVVKIYAGSDKSNQELNWKTEYSIEESLRDAWNWELKLKEKNETL